MFSKIPTLAALTVAVVFTAGVGTSAPALAHDPGAAVAAGAAGLVGGMIIGGALADSARPEPVDDEVVVVHRPHRRVYVEEDVPPPPPRCWREEWRDRWGDMHFRRVCR